VGESGCPNSSGTSDDAPDGTSGLAAKEGSHPYASAPTSAAINGDGGQSDDDHIELYWDFNAVTLPGILTALLTVMVAAVVVISTVPYISLD